MYGFYQLSLPRALTYIYKSCSYAFIIKTCSCLFLVVSFSNFYKALQQLSRISFVHTILNVGQFNRNLILYYVLLSMATYHEFRRQSLAPNAPIYPQFISTIHYYISVCESNAFVSFTVTCGDVLSSPVQRMP